MEEYLDCAPLRPIRNSKSTEQKIAYRPQSSSASRFTAGAAGFFIFNQSGERPER
jgi:hypothetical protein